jgi:hypothetical protein
MLADVALAAIALVLAVAGTLAKDPGRRLKALIIGLAVLTAALATVKSFYDNRDKDFMQAALVSTLTPPAVSYKAFDGEISAAAQRAGFDPRVECLHYGAGFTCGLSRERTQNRALLVLDQMQVAEMYKSQIQHDSNATFLDEALKHQYSNEELLEDDFRNKVGVLGFYVFYHTFGYYPDDYNWNDDVGMRVYSNKNGRSVDVVISPKELPVVSKPDLALFVDIEKVLQNKFAALH